MNCRHCGMALRHCFLDLGYAPPSNAYLTKEDLSRPELYFPLRIKVCDQCWLVQTEDYARADSLFTSDYAYYSSTSSGWLAHARRYSERMIKELGLTPASQVLEVASNDGYLLRNFVESGIPCLGIEPAVATAAQAEQLGVEVLHEFFSEAVGRQLAHEDRQADLVIGNNVFAHVPDINDFTRGLKAVLGLGGVITLEFPHLMSLIEGGQFDTVYHEHFSYLSLYTVERIFAQADLRVWKVEKLPTHGGSLRIFGCHADDDRDTTPDVGILLQEEADFGMQKRELYLDFQARADKLKDDLLGFLLEKRRNGEKVVAYGAAAKGSTFLNYAGIKGDLLSCIFDASAAKQGRFMPGSHIPILSPQAIERLNPDYVLILAWNIADEIMEENASLRQFGTKFVTAVPKLTIQ